MNNNKYKFKKNNHLDVNEFRTKSVNKLTKINILIITWVFGSFLSVMVMGINSESFIQCFAKTINAINYLSGK